MYFSMLLALCSTLIRVRPKIPPRSERFRSLTIWWKPLALGSCPRASDPFAPWRLRVRPSGAGRDRMDGGRGLGLYRTKRGGVLSIVERLSHVFLGADCVREATERSRIVTSDRVCAARADLHLQAGQRVARRPEKHRPTKREKPRAPAAFVAMIRQGSGQNPRPSRPLGTTDCLNRFGIAQQSNVTLRSNRRQRSRPGG